MYIMSVELYFIICNRMGSCEGGVLPYLYVLYVHMYTAEAGIWGSGATEFYATREGNVLRAPIPNMCWIDGEKKNLRLEYS